MEWLLLKHPETPKNRAKQWITAGRVSVDGVVIRKPHEKIPDPGDRLQLGSRHANNVAFGSGWQIHPRVSLVHLDCSLAVVNKGPGLLALSAAVGELSAQSILTDFLTGSLKPREREIDVNSLPPSFRRLQPLPVHRLDQYTSGVFCMATNAAARHNLIEQLKAHTMSREYVAFAEGRSRTPKGTWRNWLQLSNDELFQIIVSEAHKRSGGPEICEAITHFEVIAEYPVCGGARVVTQLKLRLETGRKHQIRVQAANAGLPLIGDRTYNPNVRRSDPWHIEFDRQALHAQTLSLEHPDRPGTRLTFTAEFPKDLRQLEAALREEKRFGQPGGFGLRPSRTE